MNLRIKQKTCGGSGMPHRMNTRALEEFDCFFKLFFLHLPKRGLRIFRVGKMRVYAFYPCFATPKISPTTMLIAVIITPAIASPRTNFEAPSIAP